MPTPEGTVPEPVAEAFRAGLFALPEHALPTGTSSVQSQWRVPVILVSFAGNPTVIPPGEFETALFDSTGATPNGSVFEYYQWVSGGRLHVTGRVVASVTLQFSRDYYAYNSWGLARASTPQNLYGITREALQICSGDVDWSEFDVNRDGFVDALWVIHQGVAGETSANRSHLWSITSRMTGGWTNGATFQTPQRVPGTANSFYQIDRFSSVPELSTIIPGRRAEIGTFCHEFGHSLGLPDLYDTTGIPFGLVNVGPGNWSLMSTGGYGGSGLTPEQPSHLGAWCQRFLGWTQSVRPTQDTTITLRPIGRGDPPIEVWFQGEASAEHFLIENRYRESFDQRLFNDGLIITHLDEGVIASRLPGNHVNSGPVPGLVMVEGDGDNDLQLGQNRGDPADPLPGSLNRTSVHDGSLANLKTFRGAATNLALGEIERIGADVRFRLQVRTPGWGPIELVPGGVNSMLDTGRPSRWAGGDDDGSVSAVMSQVVGGVPQIVLHSRIGDQWQPEEVITASPVAAFDPGLAILPGGDLSVVWTDAREGRSNIYLRQRIRGAWQDEVLISELPGESHHATIDTDRNGTIHLAWLNDLDGQRRIYFRRFAYISPFGMTLPVTFPGERPDPPALAVRQNGQSYLLWTDRAESPARLYMARFHPDSGVSVRNPVTSSPATSQLAATLDVDGSGDLHIAWQGAGAGTNEIHYQRRRATLSPSPRDTTLDDAANLLQNPSIACDDSGGVHAIYENWAGQAVIPKYKLFRPALGWDHGGTVLSDPDRPGFHPMAIPHGPSNVTTLFLEDDGADLRLVERRRRMGGTVTLATSSSRIAPDDPAWRLFPNPLRPGSTLELAATGSGDRFEIFDLGGRRVAELEARSDGRWQRALASSAVTRGWPAGLYFARLKGGPASGRFVVLN